MATDLILAASDAENVKPYRFEATNISVYSFEQALYHCYSYWKESWDEIFIKDKFIIWVRDELQMSFIAAKIQKLKKIRSLPERIISFLSIIYYFDEDELENLEKEIKDWQTQSQSEKLKEKGDSLAVIGSFEKAIIAYNAVLTYDKKNYTVMNNIGVCYMNIEKYDKAEKWFSLAYNIHSGNIEIIFNMIEACIHNKNFDDAEKYIKTVESNYDGGEIYYFKGEIEFGRENYDSAVMYYKRAIVKNDSFAIFRLADVYEKLKQFDTAIKVLDMLEDTNIAALMKKSSVYANANKLSFAVRCIEKALLYDNSSVELWTYLAKYHRLNNDFIKAEGAVCTALRYSRDDLAANLEMAKIKRVQGKMKEYRISMYKIFKNLKTGYRDTYF